MKKTRKLTLAKETLRRLDPGSLSRAAGASLMFDCNFSIACPTDSCRVSCGDSCTQGPLNCNPTGGGGGQV